MRLLIEAFWPAPVGADRRERLHVAPGALLGIAPTALLCLPAGAGIATGTRDAWPWLVAPMGASAVPVFGVPERCQSCASGPAARHAVAPSWPGDVPSGPPTRNALPERQC